MNKSLIVIILISITMVSNGQLPYLPYNIKQAYDNNTRDCSGKPGEKYFQNSANYKIDVKFNPENGLLEGKEEIIYYNNSPDSLYYVVIRLYQDILMQGNSRERAISKEYLTNGVKIIKFRVNEEYYGKNYIYKYERKGTNLIAMLNSYLVPGDSIRISIEWESVIPAGHVQRYGKYGDGNWFIAYWYPQVSVYDDIDGWDELDYTGTYEFYNDFNNYDVQITLPHNYLAWATGTWVNPRDILSKEMNDKLVVLNNKDTTLGVITYKDISNKLFMTKNRSNIFRFKADSVPDFAFALSKNYIWEASSVTTDSANNKRTVVHVVYPYSATNFKGLSEIGAKAIGHFSESALGIPYPYANITIFNGNGGMEFPMMVNMRNATHSENVFTAMHELFHAYFPFYTGINERKYAWLDEGLTTYLAVETESVINAELNFPISKIVNLYNDFAGLDKEPPLFFPSYQTKNYVYYHHAYYRSSIALLMLEKYIGRDKFRELVREFAGKWAHRHPTGYDFIFTLKANYPEDLNWLINPWFFGAGYADLSIESVTEVPEGINVFIRNNGGLPVPINLKVIPNDSSAYFLKEKACVWKEKTLHVVHIPTKDTLRRLELGGYDIPDKVFDNNIYKFDKNN